MVAGSKSRRKRKKVALLIDFNSARDLQTIIRSYELAQKRGNILFACAYAEEKDLGLISTMSGELERRGIEIRITTGACEVVMALDIVELSYSDKADIITVCTRRDILMPALIEVKRLGKKLVILSPISIPSNLEEIADEIETI